MKRFIANESAVAYSIVAITCIFLLISIVYVVSSPIVNLVFSVVNADIIPMGIMSDRTRDTLLFQKTIWQAIPFFVAIMLLLVYPIIRSLMKKRAEGE
jgi:hypothetical protein